MIKEEKPFKEHTPFHLETINTLPLFSITLATTLLTSLPILASTF